MNLMFNRRECWVWKKALRVSQLPSESGGCDKLWQVYVTSELRFGSYKYYSLALNVYHGDYKKIYLLLI